MVFWDLGVFFFCGVFTFEGVGPQTLPGVVLLLWVRVFGGGGRFVGRLGFGKKGEGGRPGKVCCLGF